MLLKEFIAETLTSITEGIIDAEKRVKTKGAEIAPPELGGMQRVNNERLPIYDVHFEVELTEAMSKSGKKGIGVSFGNIGVGVSNEKGGENASSTKIRFTIPMVYPCRHSNKTWASTPDE